MSRRAPSAPPAPRPPEATPALDAEQLLEACFGREPAGWVLLVDAGGHTAIDVPARFQRGRWRQLGPHRFDAEPGIEDLIARRTDARFRLLRRNVPDYSGALLPSRIAWATVKVPLADAPPVATMLPPLPGAPRPGEPGRRRDPAEVAAIRDRFGHLPVAPGILVDAGTEITGLWRLAAPLEDLQRLRTILFALARHLGAAAPSRWLIDRADPTDPRRAALALPGTTCDRVYPTVPVVATLESAAVVDVGELERALST